MKKNLLRNIHINNGLLMSKKMYCFMLAVLLLFISVESQAQKATVRVTVEPSEIMIGEQAVVNLEVIAPIGRTIMFPVYEDTIVSGIEVLGMLPTDTTMSEVMKLNQRYIITSFDSTLYHVPFMPILDGQDTLKSNDFGLKVMSPELSDTTLAYLDKLKKQETDSIDFVQLGIREPYADAVLKAPFVWKDYLDYILYILIAFLVFALIAIGVLLYVKKRNKGYYFKPKEVIPPHIIALKALEELKSRQLCQQGLEKEYYTHVSDIIRDYIDQRYHIDAPEMISEDIIDAVRRVTEGKSVADNLAQILRTADLVKFAKYIPFPDENDLTYVNATLFVNQTKEEAPQVDEKGKPIEPKANAEKVVEPVQEIKKENNNTESEKI